ncbi:uncharacterized protein B0T15DRAFT_538595 [Chaetomium strumarium]|uniref:Uncharacterized protein n=1 Tax=Chaetomium strumarium TaxID=1170767 RepID=A0AAJ0GMW6_9PEZI|nr:hypothetical protein B0T15DRAFT_538595 [Chaetomium strumarium]
MTEPRGVILVLPEPDFDLSPIFSKVMHANSNSLLGSGSRKLSRYPRLSIFESTFSSREARIMSIAFMRRILYALLSPSSASAWDGFSVPSMTPLMLVELISACMAPFHRVPSFLRGQFAQIRFVPLLHLGVRRHFVRLDLVSGFAARDNGSLLGCELREREESRKSVDLRASCACQSLLLEERGYHDAENGCKNAPKHTQKGG